MKIIKDVIIIIYFLFINNFFIVAQNYTVVKDTILFEDSFLNKKIEVINDKYEIVIESYNIPGFFYKGQFGTSLYIKYNNKKGWIFSNNLKKNYKENLNKKIIGCWTYAYNFDAIDKQDFSIIYNNDKEPKQSYKEFLNYYNPLQLIINNSIILYSAGMGGEIFYIDDTQIITSEKYKIIGRVPIKGSSNEKQSTIIIEIVDKDILNISGWGFEFLNLKKVNDNSLFLEINKLRNNALLSFNLYFTPSVPNLRFRESPDLNGKFIRSLNQGEKLELIEKGKEETIDGKKGIWVRVKTEKGEVGWCFDAYLEPYDEVKKK